MKKLALNSSNLLQASHFRITLEEELMPLVKLKNPLLSSNEVFEKTQDIIDSLEKCEPSDLESKIQETLIKLKEKE